MRKRPGTGDRAADHALAACGQHPDQDGQAGSCPGCCSGTAVDEPALQGQKQNLARAACRKGAKVAGSFLRLPFARALQADLGNLMSPSTNLKRIFGAARDSQHHAVPRDGAGDRAVGMDARAHRSHVSGAGAEVGDAGRLVEVCFTFVLMLSPFRGSARSSSCSWPSPSTSFTSWATRSRVTGGRFATISSCRFFRRRVHGLCGLSHAGRACGECLSLAGSVFLAFALSAPRLRAVALLYPAGESEVVRAHHLGPLRGEFRPGRLVDAASRSPPPSATSCCSLGRISRSRCVTGAARWFPPGRSGSRSRRRTRPGIAAMSAGKPT
ncbi:MAG: hypothetical protein MZV63_06235 [Marinilabiliales bacterium]|nr:hypothetical protein [Marinilabiliales bacterium]